MLRVIGKKTLRIARFADFTASECVVRLVEKGADLGKEFCLNDSDRP